MTARTTYRVRRLLPVSGDVPWPLGLLFSNARLFVNFQRFQPLFDTCSSLNRRCRQLQWTTARIKHDADCTTTHFACDWFSRTSAHIKSALKTSAPDAYTLLSRMSYSTDEQIKMVAAIDTDGKKPAEAARAWVDENESIWKAWLPINSPHRLPIQ